MTTPKRACHTNPFDDGIGATLADGATFARANGNVGAVGKTALASAASVLVHIYRLLIRLRGKPICLLVLENHGSHTVRVDVDHLAAHLGMFGGDPRLFERRGLIGKIQGFAITRVGAAFLVDHNELVFHVAANLNWIAENVNLFLQRKLW